ncbi:MAG: phosphoglycerate kinase [Patescibacteria group bacterium]|jgi:phosphoglycerate kinase
MKSLREAKFKNKNVVLRVDYNIEIVNGKILDDTRIKSTLKTIDYILKAGAKKITLISHLGRPKGTFDEKYVLKPAAIRLAELLKIKEIKTEEGFYQISNKIVMLENIRFNAREESEDKGEREGLAKKLAKNNDIYIDDAFANVHRKHASIYELAQILPCYSGFLLEKETLMLSKLLKKPRKPFVCILGGAKVDTKIGVIKNLVGKVDNFLIGGKIGNAFLAARGLNIKKSKIDTKEIRVAAEILKMKNINIQIPLDVSWSQDEIFDIGPKTISAYKKIIASAQTIFWNGPMGYIEGDEKYKKGSQMLMKVISEVSGTTIVSGGETVSVAEDSGLGNKITFLSTGGGATLEFLTGIKLPGLEVLGYYK